MVQRLAGVIVATILMTNIGTTQAAEIGVTAKFGDLEISIVRSYYQEHYQHKSKGKKGAKSLPPGIAKNLQRGKSLPPGIAKRDLPADLTTQLPPVQKGFERVIVDGKVLLIEVATQVVYDILEEILLK